MKTMKMTAEDALATVTEWDGWEVLIKGAMVKQDPPTFEDTWWPVCKVAADAAAKRAVFYLAGGTVHATNLGVEVSLRRRPHPAAGPPFTDIRMVRPDVSLYDLIPALPGLEVIRCHPPAAGPEVELVFATGEGAEPADKDFIRAEVERITGRRILAIRTRQDGQP